jgi:hypothetical protein
MDLTALPPLVRAHVAVAVRDYVRRVREADHDEDATLATLIKDATLDALSEVADDLLRAPETPAERRNRMAAARMRRYRERKRPTA